MSNNPKAVFSHGITGDELHAAFVRIGRPEQFSLSACHALVEYYDELAEDIGEDVDLDLIGLACDWSEYGSVREMREDFSYWRKHTSRPLASNPAIHIPCVPFRRYEPSGIRMADLEEYCSWVQTDHTLLDQLGNGGLLLSAG